jgi:hypothetical protein
MQYLEGAPLEPPLADDPSIILFHFFSSASAMVALAISLYERLVQ